jgi:biotin carboxylase
VPPFGDDPVGWLAAAKRVAWARHVDVLFPTQEQVTVLAAFADGLGVRTIVPPFAAIRRVQDKVSATETLLEAGVPQPASVVVRSEGDLARVDRFPVFVKRAISTASAGVRRASDQPGLIAAARDLGVDAHGLVVQRGERGPLAMVQAVADRGRVIAHHANVRVREGLGGGASTKESLPASQTSALVQRLAAYLGWHGGLSLDAILTADGPMVIDVNPRLVEPGNALLSGVDLVDAMLSLASDGPPHAQPPSEPGVRSHVLLLAVLGAACGEHPRRSVASELAKAMTRCGAYASGAEELTPLRDGPISAVPVAVAASCALAWPRSFRWFESSSVGAYALTPRGWEQLLAAVGR